MVFRGRKLSLRMYLILSWWRICCLFLAVDFSCPLKWDFGGMGSMQTRILARLEFIDLIIQLMFLRLKYTGDSFLSTKWFVRSVWSKLPNKHTIVAPSGHLTYWKIQNHYRNNELQLLYQFIQPPVAWGYLWLNTFLSFTEFISWSRRQMFSECRLLHVQLNTLTMIVIE